MENTLVILVLLLGGLFVVLVPSVQAGRYEGYTSLDPTQPILFDGAKVEWNGKIFQLDENTIFLDYRLDNNQIATNPYAFNTIQDAVAALQDGSQEKPMLLLTAPGVYWVDDPDDPEIRMGVNGGTPFGISITCNHLYFYGLSTVADNVVFAVNRGQTQGSAGNYTMFNIRGNGLKSENVTFGNFCNVDLEFPLDESLSRAKRTEAIAQAQLFSYSSSDGVAINTNFISRLNLLPFAMTYINCHLESSGHASFYNSVYIGCSLEFYNVNYASGKFFDCDIYITPFFNNYNGKTLYQFGFVDGTGSGGVCVDTRFHRSKELIDNNIAVEISWDRVPQSVTTRGYQHNVTLDGIPYLIQETATPGATVVIPEESDLLKAYKVVHNGKTYYNVPNMLSGADPFGYTDAIKAAALANGKPETYYLNIPMSVTLRVLGSSTIRSGQTTTEISYGVAPGSYETSLALGEWQFITSSPDLVEITRNTDNTITVAGKDTINTPVEVLVVVRNTLGIEAATKITVEPAFISAPEFTQQPIITTPKDGYVSLDYKLNLEENELIDESVITWYRVTDLQGSNPYKVAVTRLDQPEVTYKLSEGDVGYFIMATIAPKHNRSDAGTVTTVLPSFMITDMDIIERAINTNFQNFPTDPQPSIITGTWTVDGYFAPECVDDKGSPRYSANPNSWTYGPGESGSAGYFGLNQTARGARLFYTPVEHQYQDMTVIATFAPDKSAGQGFGSATGQFLEVYIKYDLQTLTGYGLRIQRLSAAEIEAIGYNGDGAVAGCAFSLVEYKNGVVNQLTDPVMSSVFLTECTVELNIKDGRLLAQITSTAEGRSGDTFDYLREVHFNVPIQENSYGGTGMLFTGTVGSNSVLVTEWKTNWDTGN